MEPSTIEIVATAFFGCAVLHTFLVKQFEQIAQRFPSGSVGENFFHFLGEVEVVFGIWAAFLVIVYAFLHGLAIYDQNHQVIGGAIHYLESINYTEPAFVFVIMAMAGSRPVIMLAEKMVFSFSRLLPFNRRMSFYVATLILGPLLGSFITEPAAMTVTALILLEYFYSRDMSPRFMYATIGLLFVNISIGGTLTHFAAPPVLMVASKWHWGIGHMIGNFGYKAVIAVVIGTIATAMVFRKDLKVRLDIHKRQQRGQVAPTWWIYAVHLIFLAMVVYTAHHMVLFMGIFLFFLGFVAVTQEYQDRLKLRESLLVAFFLGGLVTLGNMQAWWLRELLAGMSDLALFFGAAGLTAITDNAALTYLGSLVDLSDSAKYNLVAGAVAGGGLTVIANAPNPAGFGILKSSFGPAGISPLGLLLGALLPTMLACACFQILPSF